jgi:hypothetical protein
MSNSPTMLIADFGHIYEMSNLKTLAPWDGVKVSGNDRGTLYAYKSTIETNFKKARGDDAEVQKIILLNSKDIENAVLQMKACSRDSSVHPKH